MELLLCVGVAMEWIASQPDQRQHVHSEMVFVVYDRATGDIRHIHRAFGLAGGPEPSAREEEVRAVELARRHGHTSGDLRVLRTDPTAPDPGGAWCVDVDRQEVMYQDPGLSKGGDGKHQG